MNTKTNSVLSIGIIFKNDIRCIEHCLKALQPLRDAVPCELVMADTGSEDGSREIAERYADILIDFPWINDFAAARNAVIDRCSGEWYLSVDTDEYLDGDFSDLLEVLEGRGEPCDLCRVNIRNYANYELEGPFTDFLALRIFRMSTGLRYEGTIHEHLAVKKENASVRSLLKVIFKHDGYVGFGGEAGRAKRERNMILLREALKRDPDSLLLRLQTIESGEGEKDYLALLRRAVALVKGKAAGWKIYGPPIFRYAVTVAADRQMSEFRSWVRRAEEWFPESYFTRIDVNYSAMIRAWEEKDYEECVRRGELLREAHADFRAGRGNVDCVAVSSLKAGSPYFEMLAGNLLAAAYQQLGRAEQAVPALMELDYGVLDQTQASNMAKTLCVIRCQSAADTTVLVRTMWEGLCAPVPNERQGALRRAAFLSVGAMTFQASYRKNEKEREDFHRHAYTAFLPLAGICVMGDAAEMMESGNSEGLRWLLSGVENWAELPAAALIHALEMGVDFPLPERPMDIEEIDNLAIRAAQELGEDLTLLTRAAEAAHDWQTLAWARGLALAMTRSWNWKERGSMDLARIFAKVEGVYLSSCYTADALENIRILPALHRFAWYCAQAFRALDAGNAAEYVRLLRKGLCFNERAKDMVEFLVDHTPTLQQASPELLDLAEKVRTMLSAYPPDDPAVAVLKASPAYQKVAHLIEG